MAVHRVDSRRARRTLCSVVVARNRSNGRHGLRRVDAVEQEDTRGRDIGRHPRDTFQKL